MKESKIRSLSAALSDNSQQNNKSRLHHPHKINTIHEEHEADAIRQMDLPPFKEVKSVGVTKRATRSRPRSRGTCRAATTRPTTTSSRPSRRTACLRAWTR